MISVSDCSFPPDLGTVVYDGLSCYIPATCTGTYVCADVPVLGKPVSAYLELDDCSQILKIGIENYKFDVLFDDLQFGMKFSSHFVIISQNTAFRC